MKTVLVYGGMLYARALFQTATERSQAVVERNHVLTVLGTLHAEVDIQKVIACGVDGAGSVALSWASIVNVDFDMFSADFTRYGSRAMTVRDDFALEDAAPDIVVVFPSKDDPYMVEFLARARMHQLRRVFEVRPCCEQHPLPVLSPATAVQ